MRANLAAEERFRKCVMEMRVMLPHMSAKRVLLVDSQNEERVEFVESLESLSLALARYRVQLKLLPSSWEQLLPSAIITQHSACCESCWIRPVCSEGSDWRNDPIDGSFSSFYLLIRRMEEGGGRGRRKTRLDLE